MATRRGVLLAGLAGGAVVALSGATAWRALEARRDGWRALNTDPRVFLRIATDDAVTVFIKHLEMGQGIMTGLTTLVAEELDADWAQMQAELAPGDQALFKNGLYGRQATAASTSIHNSWLQMRQIGAAARNMLVTAAAQDWGVSASEITVTAGIIAHAPSGRSTGFGAMAEAAMAQPVPEVETLALKSPDEFRLIGTELLRPDGPAKVDGSARFSIDMRRTNMLHGVVARAPRFGARLAGFDASAALAVEDVVEVVEVPSGVAVLAENTWAAMQGRAALELDWDDSAAETRSSAEMWEDYERLSQTEGLMALDRGDVEDGFAVTPDIGHFSVRVPFLAHAPLEPLNATIELVEGGARVWAGCQLHTLDQWAVADALDLPRDAVRIETPFTGSSFGRRAYSRSDWMVELAHMAGASRAGRPVQILWTREDDLAGGVYRPMALHKARVGLGPDGRLHSWDHQVVCKSLMKDTPWEIYLQEGGVDRASVGGLVESPYAVPNMRIRSMNAETPIPVGFWRSIGDSHTVLAQELIMDVMAERAGVDPLAFRIAHLGGDLRERAVLDRVTEMAGWGRERAPGEGLGLALSKDHIIGKTTHVAMVAEVVDRGAAFPEITRIFTAVDCGIPVNPNIIRTQVESSVSFAISTIWHNAITHQNGVVEQSNFDSYEPTRMWDMPEVVLELLPSDAPPSGIGEVAVAPVAPSVLNAIYAATGRRHFNLPLMA